ncbi:hypothetical protein L1987_67913 [Smallanthus sonchifolius]|uniref:Uncharacterized protein n=1 Tax=Smallanthus sonchifolius TaxID=185202 RepID=A0ACB9B3L4_9ASTR|nr:hypothetical protein L1987_67913 [Smallanthus sonchifolius]
MTYEEDNAVTLLIAIEEPERFGGGGGGGGGCTSVGDSFWWWAKLVVVFIFLAFLGVLFFLWIGPFVMNKEVIPVLNWET